MCVLYVFGMDGVYDCWMIDVWVDYGVDVLVLVFDFVVFDVGFFVMMVEWFQLDVVYVGLVFMIVFVVVQVWFGLLIVMFWGFDFMVDVEVDDVMWD